MLKSKEWTAELLASIKAIDATVAIGDNTYELLGGALAVATPAEEGKANRMSLPGFAGQIGAELSCYELLQDVFHHGLDTIDINVVPEPFPVAATWTARGPQSLADETENIDSSLAVVLYGYTSEGLVKVATGVDELLVKSVILDLAGACRNALFAKSKDPVLDDKLKELVGILALHSMVSDEGN